MSLRDLAVLIAICLVWAGASVMSKMLISRFGVPPPPFAGALTGVMIIALRRNHMLAPLALMRRATP